MYAFGFEDPTLISGDWGSIRDIAIKYVTEIRSIQPEGPYYLGGYSVGGLIALEMASILLEDKEQVGLLVMVDTLPWIPEARINTKKLRESLSFAFDKFKVSSFFFCTGVKLLFGQERFLKNTPRKNDAGF